MSPPADTKIAGVLLGTCRGAETEEAINLSVSPWTKLSNIDSTLLVILFFKFLRESSSTLLSLEDEELSLSDFGLDFD